MKISVITTTYNSAKTVRDTLESVLQQTDQDLELIVVDGASKDETMDIVREYEPKFEGRLRWVSEPDKGIYDAMNKGIGMATGEVVGPLNSDDFYTSNEALQWVDDAFSANPNLDAVYGDIHYVDNKDLTKPTRYYSSRIFRRSLMRLGFMPAHPSFYCRKQCYEQWGNFDTSFRVAADFENLLRLIYIGKIRTQYIPKDFVTMRLGGASTSGIQSHLQILRDHRRALKKNGVYSNIFLLGLRYIYKLFEYRRL